MACHFFYGWSLAWLVIPFLALLLVPVSCLLLPSRDGFGELVTLGERRLVFGVGVGAGGKLARRGKLALGRKYLSTERLEHVTHRLAARAAKR